MKGLSASIVGLCASIALAVAPASARPPHAPVARACCHVPAGTVVEIELAEPVTTKEQRPGDTFGLRLATPLVVDGRLLLRTGTPGIGEVIESARPGLGGKAAKLVLAARYLRTRHARVPLQALQLSARGKDNSTAANVVGLSGIAFGPLGFVGLAVTGGNVEFPEGLSATARIAQDVFLPSQGHAPPGVVAAAAAQQADAAEPPAGGWIDIPPPPAGQGQVVFFRRKSLLGTGQWFKVREEGKALGKLSNGAYFVQVTEPGRHTYTATTEPELKDRLTLEVDPGETYFVEGTLTKGVVIGTANISPSDRAAFNNASKDLKLAPRPRDDEPDNSAGAAEASGASEAQSAADAAPR